MSAWEVIYRLAYGHADDVLREVYGAAPQRKPRPKVRPRPAASRAPRTQYRVTADARVRCQCGVYVYTERRNNGPAALPTNCWRCNEPLLREGR